LRFYPDLVFSGREEQIGRVQVEDNLRGRDRMRFQKHVDQQTVDGLGVAGYFLVPVRFLRAQLQAIERALAGQ